MLVLLAGIFVVHIATVIMLFVSTIANPGPGPAAALHLATPRAGPLSRGARPPPFAAVPGAMVTPGGSAGPAGPGTVSSPPPVRPHQHNGVIRFQVWMVGTTAGGKGSWGLWLMCNGTCRQLPVTGSEEASLKAAQAFMILSIIFSVIALVMFIVQLFTLEKGKRFYITGAIMLVCWLCILIGASIYTARFTGLRAGFINPHHGYSFILAWICFCFSFIIGILYLVLRKK
ncbi:Epithelial membrane protein 1 [Aix galericulata]|nr:Epithelial membrane protein 1 [Aix galericulata]